MFNGCSPKIIAVNKIDTSNKSIIIIGSGELDSVLRRAFRQEGWRVTTQAGHTMTQGVNTGITKYKYNARYVLKYRIWLFGAINHMAGNYNFEISIFDNKIGDEVVTFSQHNPGQGATKDVDEMAQMVISWIKNNSINGNSNLNENIEKLNNIKIINKNETYLNKNRRVLIKNNQPLNGIYKTIQKNNQYTLYEYNDGVVIDGKKYDKYNTLLERMFYDNGQASHLKSYYKDGSLKSIINMSKKRNSEGHFYRQGLSKFFHESGDLYFEVNFQNGVGIDGFIYTGDGTKRKMTEAHFNNFKIPTK